MNGECIVRHLRCKDCGTELPVMGELVTFQCQTCYQHWIIVPEGLSRIQIYTAQAPEECDIEPVLLPFWVIPIDGCRLRREVEESCSELKELSAVIASTHLENDNTGFDQIAAELTGIDVTARRTHLLAEVSRTRSVPSESELGYLLGKIAQRGTYMIYVPAFKSSNTFTYLKIGRLLTRGQPALRISKKPRIAGAVSCILQPGDATHLIDYIFISTLPDSIQENGEFLRNVRIEPSSPPRLVEIPFADRGNSLVCLAGGFEISSRLIELPESVS